MFLHQTEFSLSLSVPELAFVTFLWFLRPQHWYDYITRNIHKQTELRRKKKKQKGQGRVPTHQGTGCCPGLSRHVA